MSSLIDYLSSLILGAALLGIILNANEMASENQSVYNGDMLVQEMLVQTAHLIEGEFRNMGLGVPESDKTVMSADSSSITFLYDYDRKGVVDTIRYYVGTTAEMVGTQNDLDRPLYRTLNGGTPAKVGVVTVFKLRYLTREAEVLATPVVANRLGEIHSVEITMEVQNPYAVKSIAGASGSGGRDALYSSSLWQQTRLASQNTRR